MSKIDVVVVVHSAEARLANPVFTWPDAYLERWGEVYLANPQLRVRGVLFETFLLAPEALLLAASLPPGMVPGARLLPRQAAVRRRLDEQANARQLHLALGLVEVALRKPGARVADGRVVEKLAHHARPRSRANFSPRAKGGAR